ncbi:single-stranded DNA-binding protein [Cellvibrio sp. QJXJ]|uniref:single-stranded DNA-binding protein n=1 Tax=Cellvibrio sp. QJXJ TaxID=2964606 RepID=UPI0021C40B95|nr:single-stranded DNA-binding protein [Cellvibrio sp. QJXJ]UUA74225.1 single-stranded DNA-binding protein [Cellvibrio sp. QJXJ]
MGNYFAGEGNLGSAPTLSYVPIKNGTEQKAVLKFSARFNVDKLNQATGEYEDSGGFWGKVEIWGKRAEIFNDHLVKGCRVYVAGSMSQETYTATKGVHAGQEQTANVISADVVAIVPLGIEKIIYAERKGQSNGNAGGDSFDYANQNIPHNYEDEIPE